jgi:hypothetical protein
MDVNSYVLEVLVRERLAEMRAKGERLTRLREASGESRPLRFALGHALIRMGQRLRGARSSRTVTEPRRSTHEPVRG